MTRWTEKEYALMTGKRPVSSKSKNESTSLGVDAYRSNVQGWREIGGKKYYFKSLYEINYAKVLEFKKARGEIIDWLYEPELFRFPKESYSTGPFFYKPDFKVLYFNRHEWHEVKGWLNPSSKKKLKRFAKHYPEEVLMLIDFKWFSDHKMYKKLIPSWESLPSSSRSPSLRVRKRSRY